MSRRPVQLLAALEAAGGDAAGVFFTDADAVWRRDPARAVAAARFRRCDAMAAPQATGPSRKFNPGVAFFRRNAAGRALLADWARRFENATSVNLVKFNAAARDAGATVCGLPPAAFPDGRRFKKGRAAALGAAAVVHANWTPEGKAQKVATLARLGLWDPGAADP